MFSLCRCHDYGSGWGVRAGLVWSIASWERNTGGWPWSWGGTGLTTTHQTAILESVLLPNSLPRVYVQYSVHGVVPLETVSVRNTLVVFYFI